MLRVIRTIWTQHKVGGIAKVEHEDFDASTMHDNPQLAAEFGMPDDGSGEKKVYKIVDSGKKPALLCHPLIVLAPLLEALK